MCKRAIDTTWGLRPNEVLWLYELVIKPFSSLGLQRGGRHWTPYPTDYCLRKPYSKAISGKDSLKDEHDGHVKPMTMGLREYTKDYGDKGRDS
ncbi:hypothetical protein EVAR_71414_1 [Eumeta japonica]|uniref:Uncharacterized protein n=1 Tax=Eumeta variegata TaxID=151549 RepID=A0A4C1SU50_EUMVA|nr:hypothetical protein EVAR_71414_1 [Eumeta japonica]